MNLNIAYYDENFSWSKSWIFLGSSFKNLKLVEDFITNAGVRCTAELLESEKKISLSEAILNYEKRFQSDLIMIMT